MAMKPNVIASPPWSSPIWPDRLPEATSMKVVYGVVADELVIRFWPDAPPNAVVVPVTTPAADYAGVMVDGTTGLVVGIHVYPLLAFAIQRHPAWKALAEANPPETSIVQIVTDIRGLFTRFGVADPGED